MCTHVVRTSEEKSLVLVAVALNISLTDPGVTATDELRSCVYSDDEIRLSMSI